VRKQAPATVAFNGMGMLIALLLQRRTRALQRDRHEANFT